MARRSPHENANGTRRDTGRNARSSGSVSGLVRAVWSPLRPRAGARAELVARQLRRRRDELIREQKDRAARELATVGQAVRAAAERLHERRAHALAPYATAAAEGIEALARAIRRRDAAELAEDLRQAARRRPGAVIGAAFLAGVAVGRFVKAGLAPEQEQEPPLPQQRKLRGH